MDEVGCQERSFSSHIQCIHFAVIWKIRMLSSCYKDMLISIPWLATIPCMVNFFMFLFKICIKAQTIFLVPTQTHSLIIVGLKSIVAHTVISPNLIMALSMAADIWNFQTLIAICTETKEKWYIHRSVLITIHVDTWIANRLVTFYVAVYLGVKNMNGENEMLKQAYLICRRMSSFLLPNKSDSPQSLCVNMFSSSIMKPEMWTMRINMLLIYV